MRSKNGGALFLVILFLTGLMLGQSAAPSQSNLNAPAAAVDSGTHAAAPATAAPKAPRFVPVLFSATDPKGSPVLGLSKDQITILDANQVVQPLQLYKGSDLPLHLGIVLLCAPRTFAQQQAAAIDLINKVIRPGIDEAFVVAARGKKPWPGERLDWKQDPAELATMTEISMQTRASLTHSTSTCKPTRPAWMKALAVSTCRRWPETESISSMSSIR